LRGIQLLLRVLIFLLFATFLNAADKPYSYSYTPKSVYSNQVFPVTILVKHYNPKNPPHFEFDIISQLQPIDNRPNKLINQNEAFFTFYFKAEKNLTSIKIPQLSIWNLDHTYMLQPKEIKVKNLDTQNSKNFSNLLASNLRVNQVKIDPYDSQNSLITLKLEALEANLEDIKIPGVTDDGIEDIKRDNARVTASYYFIIPSNIKKVEFSYYNLIKNRFISKDITTYKKSGYSQTIELSPKDFTFDKIKMYITFGSVVVLLLLLFFTKDMLYLVLSVILIAFTIYIYMPKATLRIQEGANIYILPTKNSNISKQLDREITTKLIRKYKNFNKIEYKNIIGWVKDEDIRKN
jgi:hypothetical protein